MPNPRRHVPVALVLILGLTCTSCFFTRTRNIFRRGKKVTPGSVPSLMTATRDELNTQNCESLQRNQLVSGDSRHDAVRG